MEQEEEWMSVVGLASGFYDGLYEVSNKGRWKILPRRLNCTNGSRLTKEKITRGSNSHGYRTVGMKKSRIRVQKDLHILVATAFVPNPYYLPEVNHLDADRSNNNATNLEWTDSKGNSQHALKMGLLKITKGEDRSTAKLTEVHVRTLRQCYATGKYSGRFLAKLFGIGHTTLRSIVNRRKWKHVA